MSRFLSFSASSLVLSVAVLSLAACQAAPAAQQPVELVHPPVAEGAAGYAGLEKRVSVLEGQMKDAQPTLKKVEVMETHFKALSLEMGRIAQTYEVPAAAVESIPAPVVAPASVPTVKKAEPKKVEVKSSPKKDAVPAGVLAVTSVRIGEQPKEITRIVLDTTKPAEIHYDLDNGEGLLVIDVPTAKWSATESQTLKKSPMVKSFHASQDDTGAHLVLDLKQTAKVIATARLTPSGASGNRVYVDIAPAK